MDAWNSPKMDKHGRLFDEFPFDFAVIFRFQPLMLVLGRDKWIWTSTSTYHYIPILKNPLIHIQYPLYLGKLRLHGNLLFATIYHTYFFTAIMLYFPFRYDVDEAGQEMVREKLEEVVTREPISGKCEQNWHDRSWCDKDRWWWLGMISISHAAEIDMI